MASREEVVNAAGDLAAEQLLAREAMTPREQAEAAWTPTSRLTVDEIEDRIRARRGLTPVHHQQAV
jgi:hypothetical protein